MRGAPLAVGPFTVLCLAVGSAIGALVRLGLFAHPAHPSQRLLHDVLIVAAAAGLAAGVLASGSRSPLVAMLIGFTGTTCSIGVLTVSALQLSPMWFVVHIAALPVAAGLGALAGMMLAIRPRPHRAIGPGAR